MRIITSLALKKARDDQAIGRLRGGPSTKIYALVGALGDPVGFFLTGGETHDLAGSDALLPGVAAETLIADKAYDADRTALDPLAQAGKVAVNPSKRSCKIQRVYDKMLATRYK